jgi:hypothetical protein
MSKGGFFTNEIEIDVDYLSITEWANQLKEFG